MWPSLRCSHQPPHLVQRRSVPPPPDEGVEFRLLRRHSVSPEEVPHLEAFRVRLVRFVV